MARGVHQFWCEQAIMIQRTRLSSPQWKVNTGLIKSVEKTLGGVLPLIARKKTIALPSVDMVLKTIISSRHNIISSLVCRPIFRRTQGASFCVRKFAPRNSEPLLRVTLCAIRSRYFVHTSLRHSHYGLTPFQIYCLVCANAHSCR